MGHVIALVDGSEEDGLELVHARIGEEQGGVIVRDDGGRRDCMERLLLADEAQWNEIELSE